MRKKILITGASGLTGSHLLEILIPINEYEIYIAGRKLNNTWKEMGVHSIELDFTKDWNESVLPSDLYAIIHLAQSEDFRDFPGKAAGIFNTNTLSTLKLAGYAVKTKARQFIFASSGGIYGNGDDAFKEEKDIVYKKEMGFYVGTKLCSEVILENYMSLMNVVMLRFFFVYGKDQRKEMLIPRLLNFVKNAQPIALQGDDGMKINPVHASDAAQAIKAALLLNESHKINVAGPEVLSLKQIGKIMGDLVNKTPGFLNDMQKQPGHLIGDISKMSRLLVPPKITFKEGIKTLL